MERRGKEEQEEKTAAIFENAFLAAAGKKWIGWAGAGLGWVSGTLNRLDSRSAVILIFYSRREHPPPLPPQML